MRKLTLSCILSILCIRMSASGGIFESKTSDEALMFKYAVNKASKDMPQGYALTYDIQELTDDDSFTLSKISKYKGILYSTRSKPNLYRNRSFVVRFLPLQCICGSIENQHLNT
jgi:hypothetical protein